MTRYFIVKYLHVLGAIVILGTGTGIAFFRLMAHRSGDPAFIARTAATVVIADMLFTLTAVLLQPVTGGLLMALSATTLAERWLVMSLGLYAVARTVLDSGHLHADRNAQSGANRDGAAAAAATAVFRTVSSLVWVRHSRLRFSDAHSLADGRQAMNAAGDREPCPVLDRVGLHRAGDLL
jgi:uncharacterized membrane protein